MISCETSGKTPCQSWLSMAAFFDTCQRGNFGQWQTLSEQFLAHGRSSVTTDEEMKHMDSRDRRGNLPSLLAHTRECLQRGRPALRLMDNYSLALSKPLHSSPQTLRSHSPR